MQYPHNCTAEVNSFILVITKSWLGKPTGINPPKDKGPHPALYWGRDFNKFKKPSDFGFQNIPMQHKTGAANRPEERRVETAGGWQTEQRIRGWKRPRG